MIDHEWKECRAGKVMWTGLGFFFVFSTAMAYGGVRGLGIGIPKAGGGEFVSSPCGDKNGIYCSILWTVLWA